MSMSYARASKLASICHKEFDFQFFVYQEEAEYKPWLTCQRLYHQLRMLPDSSKWNWLICAISLLGIVTVALDVEMPSLVYACDYRIGIFDLTYNIVYFVHAIGMFINEVSDSSTRNWNNFTGYIFGVISYCHYIFSMLYKRSIISSYLFVYLKLGCYYLRLHRPIRILWRLNHDNLSGNIIVLIMKYSYTAWLIRITFVILWAKLRAAHYMLDISQNKNLTEVYHGEFRKFPFYWSTYVVGKMFIPIGPQLIPVEPFEATLCMVVMMTGFVMVFGVILATFSIYMSVSLRQEEAFRSRFKLIIKDMHDNFVPAVLREKVETFYRMYWHKQRGVSRSELMLTFPPTTISLIYSEIYFEAQQRSLILRDLSNQFLSEVAKVMSTTNFIPGDTIMPRKAAKSSIIHIAYGDVEMMTAEDDLTPMLRFSRGTILNGSGGCVETGCACAHVQIAAATFCTAHMLRAADLWKVILKFGKYNGQAFIVLSAFEEHFEKVKRHYANRAHPEVKYKSSILQFKRNVIDLKDACDSKGKKLLERNDVFLEVAGCYVMRNLADLSLLEEADRICLRSTFPCILQPNSSLQLAWSLLIAAITLFITLLYPYVLVLKRNVSVQFRFLDNLFSVAFILDILVHLTTGEKIEEGVPITFRQTSAHQMRSFLFALDLAATLPIFEFVGEGYFAGINKLLKLPKFFRSLKSLGDMSINYSNYIHFVSISLTMLLATYLLAALQHYFMCFLQGKCFMDFAGVGYWTDVPHEDTASASFMIAMYWAICMLSMLAHKTADMAGKSTAYRFFNMGVMELCVLVRVCVEAFYAAHMIVSFVMKQEYEACITEVKSFLIRNHVDPILRHRFVSYLQLCWHIDKAYAITHKKQSLRFDLPPHVSAELLATQRSKYIQTLPFAKYLNEQQLTHIAAQARLFYTSPMEVIINTGDLSPEMYIIKAGMVEVLSPVTHEVVRTLGNKEHFGLLECFFLTPAYYTVRAVTHIQLLCISRKTLDVIFVQPKIKEAMKYAHRLPEFKSLKIRYDSFLSYEMPAPIPNRSFFPLLRKHEPDTAFMQPFQRLGFLSVLRYVFPRFTIRPDGKYLQRYEYFRSFCALASSFVFSSYIYMSLQFPNLKKVAMLLDFCAYFDIVQRMLVGYYNEKGLLVYHPASTAAHYIKSAFVVDLLGSLPMERLDAGRSQLFVEFKMYRQLGTMQMLMCNRLLQLYRVPSAIDSLDAYIARKHIVLILKCLPFLLGLINVLTGILVMYTTAVYADDKNFVFMPRPKQPKTFVTEAEAGFSYKIRASPFNYHLTAFFYATYEIANVGYGVFQAYSKTIVTYLFRGKVLGLLMMSFFSVRVLSLRSNVNAALATFQEHMSDVISFMRREKIPSDTKKELLDYYTYTWDKMGGTDYRSILELCDQMSLRTDAILYIYGKTFFKCPVIENSDISLLRLIGRNVNSVFILKDTSFVERDSVIDELYFVHIGYVEVKDPRDDYSVIAKLPRGSIFGNLSKSPTYRATNTFTSTTNVHLLNIKTTVFRDILRDFPEANKLLTMLRPNGENFIKGEGQPRGVEDNVKYFERSYSVAMIMSSRNGALRYLDHHAKTRHVYLIIVCLLGFLIDTYNVATQDNSFAIITILYILDCAFFIKIFINYAIANLDFDFETKASQIIARTRYFNSAEFKYDALSLLPIELFCMLASPEQFWTVLSILRLNRLFRLNTIGECMKLHNEKMNINRVLTTLTSMSIGFIIYAHSMTCTWYYIGVTEERLEPNSSWINVRPGIPRVTNIYFYSVYFIITTFTANVCGDILPRTRIEVVFTCILILSSLLMRTMYTGDFANIIQNQSFRFFNFYLSYVELRDYLKCNRVSKNLVTMMDRYSLHLWREARGVQMPHFLEIAPQYLHTKIMAAAFYNPLTLHPVFRSCESGFLRQLVRYLRLYHYDKAIYVVKENEVTDAMYFIHRGDVEEVTEDLFEEKTRELHADDYFGTLQGLTHAIPYTHSYRTLNKAQILTLCLNDWEYLLQHFPKSKSIIYKEDIGRGDDSDMELEKERIRVHNQNSKEMLRVQSQIGDFKARRAEFRAQSGLNRSTESVSTEPDLKENSNGRFPMESRSSSTQTFPTERNRGAETKTASFSGLPLHSRDSVTPSPSRVKRPEPKTDKKAFPGFTMGSRVSASSPIVSEKYLPSGTKTEEDIFPGFSMPSRISPTFQEPDTVQMTGNEDTTLLKPPRRTSTVTQADKSKSKDIGTMTTPKRKIRKTEKPLTIESPESEDRPEETKEPPFKKKHIEKSAETEKSSLENRLTNEPNKIKLPVTSNKTVAGADKETAAAITELGVQVTEAEIKTLTAKDTTKTKPKALSAPPAGQFAEFESTITDSISIDVPINVSDTSLSRLDEQLIKTENVDKTALDKFKEASAQTSGAKSKRSSTTQAQDTVINIEPPNVTHPIRQRATNAENLDFHIDSEMQAERQSIEEEDRLKRIRDKISKASTSAVAKKEVPKEPRRSSTYRNIFENDFKNATKETAGSSLKIDEESPGEQFDTELWPMDSRKHSIETTTLYEPKAGEKVQASSKINIRIDEEEEEPTTPIKRKSTVYGVDEIALAKELHTNKEIEDHEERPTTSDPKHYKIIEAAEPRKLAFSSSEISDRFEEPASVKSLDSKDKATDKLFKEMSTISILSLTNLSVDETNDLDSTSDLRYLDDTKMKKQTDGDGSV